jgi:hypothetical protein
MSLTRISAALVVAAGLATLSQPALAAPPPGYTVVSSGPMISAGNAVTRTVLECPVGLVPFGGGVSNPLFGPQSVNSSFPTPTGWSAAVSNPGPPSTFEVIFTCGTRPKHYSIARSASVLVQPGEARNAVAVCPTGSDPLGGGGFSDSGLIQISTAASYPVPGEWLVAERNGSATASHVTAFAACGRVRGYRLVSRPISVLNDGLTLGGAACPGTKVPLGGGAVTNAPGLRIDLYSTFPIDGDWDTDVRYVAAVGDPTVLWQPFVVCAGARGA